MGDWAVNVLGCTVCGRGVGRVQGDFSREPIEQRESNDYRAAM
jgi:hypothetical protein